MFHNTDLSMKKIAIIAAGITWPSYQISVGKLLDIFKKLFFVDVFELHSDTTISIREYSLIYMIKGMGSTALDIVIAANACSVPVIYETDDNFLTESQTAAGDAHPTNEHDRKILIELLERVDMVWVYSRQSFYDMRRHNSNTAILPTYQTLPALPPPSPLRAEKIIGFMGSFYKDLNFTWVIPALKELAACHPSIVFEFLGFLPKGAEDLPSISYTPFDLCYNNFIKNFHAKKWTIALAPLADIAFNRSKTNIKYREYAAAGIAGVYSNIEPYSNTIRNTATGILVDNNKDSWIEALDTLLQNTELRQTIVQNAWDDMRENYSFSRYCQVKSFALPSFVQDSSQQNARKIIGYIHMKNKQIQI